jgi:guanine deaminase
MNRYMQMALQVALAGMKSNEGGPFGAVVLCKGKVVSQAHNEVIKTNDPTAHAEVVAIRRASRKLGRYDLSDCVLYSTCEPCPMCMAAVLWARIPRIYFGCTRKDAAAIGFSDDAIYAWLSGKAGELDLELLPLEREECLKAFREWEEKPDKTLY